MFAPIDFAFFTLLYSFGVFAGIFFFCKSFLRFFVWDECKLTLALSFFSLSLVSMRVLNLFSKNNFDCEASENNKMRPIQHTQAHEKYICWASVFWWHYILHTKNYCCSVLVIMRFVVTVTVISSCTLFWPHFLFSCFPKSISLLLLSIFRPFRNQFVRFFICKSSIWVAITYSNLLQNCKGMQMHNKQRKKVKLASFSGACAWMCGCKWKQNCGTSRLHVKQNFYL